MPEPVRGNFQLINIVAGDRLRSGDVITARIREILPDGRIRLEWNGRILTARSVMTFQPGQLIRATVDRNPRGFYLHLQDAKVAVRGPGNPAAPGTILSAALVRAGLPLPDEAEAGRRNALLSRTKGINIRVARAYTELLAKGADPTADFLESLDLLFSGDDSDDTRNHQKGGREWRRIPSPDVLAEEMSDDPENNDPLLDLINRVPGKTGHWMFARNSRRFGGRNMEMVWKFRRGINPALALTVHDGRRTLEFLLEGLDHTRMAVHSDRPEQIVEKVWRTFRERLALMNIEVDDTILPIEGSDGFTPGTGDTIRDLEKMG